MSVLSATVDFPNRQAHTMTTTSRSVLCVAAAAFVVGAERLIRAERSDLRRQLCVSASQNGLRDIDEVARTAF